MTNKYIIGVDGGGTKTIAALANLDGKILKMAKSGSSNVRNVGIRKAVENVVEAIEKVLRKGKVLSTFIGLAGIQESGQQKKEEIEKELFRHRVISEIFKGKVTIGSDQIVAFRSGTDEKDGVLLIAGTGCVAHGWKDKKEAKASGWGWLADEGSAFWVGQRVFQFVLKELDGREPKTVLTRLVFQIFKLKTKKDLLNLIYSTNPTEVIPRLSILCDRAIVQGDKVAKSIMTEASRELALAVKAVIKKLNLRNMKFPLVLVGGMLNSQIVFDAAKKEIKKFAPKVYFIQPKKEPVAGAVKLALEQIK